MNPGALNNFAFATIGTQAHNVAFSITITAYDADNNVITNYAGSATLSDYTHHISPTADDGGWVNGVWTHTVTITQTSKYDVITVTDGSVNSQSNNFRVT